MVLPRAVVFGEALTDLVQGTPGQWKGYPGGAPWNVARALSRLGVSSAFAGSVSMDSLGDELLGIADLRERLQFSAACASISCPQAGAHAPALADVEGLLQRLTLANPGDCSAV